LQGLQAVMEENQPAPVLPKKGRQAILRVILYLLGVGACSIPASVIAVPFVLRSMPSGGIQPGMMPISLEILAIFYLPYAIAVVIFTRLFVIHVDRRPFETFGLAREGRWSYELLVGVILGIGLPGLIFGISCLAGWTHITGSLFSQPPARILVVLVETLIALIGVAITEEMVVRGYMLQTLKWAYGAIVALVVSSVLFGMVHLINPGAALPAFLGTALAGIFLGYCYLLTGRLWLPIGWHFGWNFALGPIFGFPVSGIDIPSWVVQRTHGPALWTGGRFGPEASLMMLIVLLIGILAVRFTIPHQPSTINH